MSAFHDYVRGLTEEIPPGYAEPGMRLYRHLVWLGASQLLAAHYPAVRDTLSDDDWQALIAGFVREARWDSHFYGDMADEFLDFLHRKAV